VHGGGGAAIAFAHAASRLDRTLKLAAALLALAVLAGCATESARPFEPGYGGGPGPQGCQDEKARAARTGEKPGC
jgi:hypothetical protein